MKQILTIGRGLHCDIVLHDATDVVSREHATLELDKSGKYYLVDTSRNGTYVNGMRIIPNQRVMVSRGDVISFAHVQTLDWNRVPRPSAVKSYLLYAAIAVGVLLLGFGAYLVWPDDGRIEVYGLQTSGDFYYDDYDYDGGSDLEDNDKDADADADADADKGEDKAKKESKPAKKSEPKAKPKSEPKHDVEEKAEAAPAEPEQKVEQPKQEPAPADNGMTAKEKREAKRAAKAAKKKKVYDAIY